MSAVRPYVRASVRTYIHSVPHPQKWSTDLPGYRIGIPIGIALRKQWTDIAIVISCSFYTIKSLNK